MAASPEAARSSNDSGRYRFLDVLKQEYGAIHAGASPAGDAQPADPLAGLTLEQVRVAMWNKETSALCFSGGGIRSASFCLGAAQALAREGYLRNFHYLSTVSGGGYTGSMLAAWAYRAGADYAEVESGLDGKSTTVDPLKHLRDYTSYLTPRYGLLSLDTWTLGSTYLRNLLLNWLILVPLVFAVLLVPHLLVALLDYVAHLRRFPSAMAADLAVWMGALLSFLMILFWRGASSLLGWSNKYTPRVIAVGTLIATISLCASAFLLRARGIDPTWTFPLQGTAQLASNKIAHLVSLTGYDVWSDSALALRRFAASNVALPFAIIYAALGAAAWFFFRILHVETRPSGDPRKGWHLFISFLAVGVVTGLGLYLWFEWSYTVARPYAAARVYWTFGPPSIFAVFGLAEMMLIGLVSKQTDDFDREWWARMGAYLLIGASAWIALFAAALLAPPILHHYLSDDQAITSALGAAVAAAGGIIARIAFTRVATTGRKAEPGELPAEAEKARLGPKGSLLLNAAGLAFLLVVLGGLAFALDALLGWISRWGSPELSATFGLNYRHTLLAVCLVAAAVTVVLSIASAFIHVNRFSLHAMYRERLIRAFLGGTRADRKVTLRGEPADPIWREDFQYRKRTADSFTEFDRYDNPIFGWLDPSRQALAPGAQPGAGGKPPPFLLVNCALNLTTGKRLAWQERKAASFTISALHAGNDETGYRSSRAYAGQVGGITLGTAMTISGAAVSPNAGLHSSPILAAVLTLFNARLGSWLGNPKDASASKEQGPTHAMLPLARELLGMTDARKKWIYLSDGGHFDNLGIYEAVKRGCRYIVAIDASADPDRDFVDLGNAIRKIRLDLGAQIELVGDSMIGGTQLGADGRYCALFNIKYPDMPGRLSSLLYVKPSIYPHPASQVPADVLQYWRSAPAFPHEPTTNQFFTESQFESYRALGEHELATILKHRRVRGDIGDLFDAVPGYIKRSEGDSTDKKPEGDLKTLAGQVKKPEKTLAGEVKHPEDEPKTPGSQPV